MDRLFFHRESAQGATYIEKGAMVTPSAAGKIQRALDVARWRLCTGCGACVSVCEHRYIHMANVLSTGILPVLSEEHCSNCGRCLDVCPGWRVPQKVSEQHCPNLSQLVTHWGSVKEVWEGYAVDHQIRFTGSSGGAATAIALYCLETKFADVVLHTGENSEQPWYNETVFSRSRSELTSRTGSRYSPASPCEGLAELEIADAHAVFIGKPCDVQGLRNAQVMSPTLQNKIALAIGIFCAGTPATAGVLTLLERLKMPVAHVGALRFRGNGWPGAFAIKEKGGEQFNPKLSYSESWGFLQAYRPFRCYLCPDGTSEFADISCGDPWYRKTKGNDAGRSLLLVRTERGRKIVNGAVQAGYLHLARVKPEIVDSSQKNLLMKRRTIWGRIATMKAFGLPAPHYDGFPLFENWLELPLAEKTRSIIGTARRILQRKYHRPIDYDWKQWKAINSCFIPWR